VVAKGKPVSPFWTALREGVRKGKCTRENIREKNEFEERRVEIAV
jgi:hypothetical protein